MKVYEKNMENLEKHFPEVASWIKISETGGRFEFVNAFSGQPNLRYLNDKGEMDVFYDMDNPQKQMEKEVRDRQFFAEDMTVLVGFGLGYLVRVIAEKMEQGHVILVLERHPEIVKLAFLNFDFTHLLESGKLAFALPEEEAITNIFETYAYKFRTGNPEIRINTYTQRLQGEYVPLMERALKIISRIRVNLTTVNQIGKTFAQNEITNLANLMRSAGVNKLKNVFQGIPAIIVSTGPSLQKNIHLLKKAKGGAVIIAVGQALRVLLAYDTAPDIIGTLDFGQANYLHFEGLLNCDHIPLMALNRTFPKLIKDYQGDLFAVSQVRLPGAIGSFWEKKGLLSSGLSVAHSCFSLAKEMGADPIIFTGQDLAFTDRSHVEGVDFAGKRVIQGAEILVINSEGKVTRKEPISWIEGFGGKRVYTNKVLLSFLQLFEQWIAHTEALVINATEGGARIKGTVEMPLSQVLEKYCQKEYDIKKMMEESHQVDEEDLGAIVKELEAGMDRSKQIIQRCKEGLRTNKLINRVVKKEGVGKSSHLQALKRKNHEATIKAQSLSADFSSLQVCIQKELTLLDRREFKIIPEMTDESEKLERGVKRNKTILSGVLNAAKDLGKTMNSTCTLLKNYHQVLNLAKRCPGKKRTHYRLGTALEEMGYLREATDEYWKEIEIVGRDKKVLYQLAEVYEKREQYRKAEELFREVEKIDPYYNKVKDRLENVAQVPGRLLEKTETYHRDGNFANTIIYARKVLAIESDSKKAEYLLNEAIKIRDAKIRQATGKEKTTTEETKEERFQKLIENSRTKLQARDLDGAAQELIEAQKLFPDREEVHWGFSTLYFIQGDLVSAEREYNYLTDKSPDKADYHFEFGQVLLKLGKIQQAIEEIEIAIEKDEKFTSFLPQLGQIFMKSKDYQKAIKCYEDYIRINPASYETFTHLGDCYFFIGAKEAAIYGYQSALEIKPDYQVALERLKIVQPSKRVLH